MWTVRSEAGRLRAVLVQESIEEFWEKKFPFSGIESNSHLVERCPHADLEGGLEQWRQLPKFLEEEGVRVFEVKAILREVLDDATVAERKRIVDEVWEGMPSAPDPEELTIEHILRGHPMRPFYDVKRDRVILPDFQRVGWPYPRDTSFTTPVGTVICKMRRYSRRFEPKVVRLVYRFDSVLSEKTEVFYDANMSDGESAKPPYIEGGDTHIIDEETIAIGVGQRSTHTGFIEAARRIFDEDYQSELKYICAVKLPDSPATDYMHLDVVINYIDQGKVLVMPYVFDSDAMGDVPKRLLLKTLEALWAQSERDGRPMEPMIHPGAFKDSCICSVYERGSNGPKLTKKWPSLVDFLIEEGKLEADGLIYVGGRPKKPNDLEHLMLALMEQARGATNIVTVKPGVVIAYERNHLTNEELRTNGIKVKEWEDSYLDMLGGPHCSTSPLWRDAM
jgi:N-dimethylarginine dimethylaminohydrolase